MAELADAQVSEACDGDIVEVQVLSSAPLFNKSENILNEIERESVNKTRFFLAIYSIEPTKTPFAATKSCHGTRASGVFVLEAKVLKGG